MKHKVSELDGALLDAAVMLAEGSSWDGDQTSSPSTEWWRGGPIIERERMMIHPSAYSSQWTAFREKRDNFETYIKQEGPTPLIAAMRAYVASKFGEEVEL